MVDESYFLTKFFKIVDPPSQALSSCISPPPFFFFDVPAHYLAAASANLASLPAALGGPKLSLRKSSR